MAAEAYFVRHGSYNLSGDLNTVGLEQAGAAKDYLLQEGIGRSALLLSSDIPRALQTAEVLHEAIGEQIITSDKLGMGSFSLNIVDLADVLAEVAGTADFNIDDADGLVVVTHAPLVAAVKGPKISEDDIAYGEIVKYRIDSLPFSPVPASEKPAGLVRQVLEWAKQL